MKAFILAKLTKYKGFPYFVLALKCCLLSYLLWSWPYAPNFYSLGSIILCVLYLIILLVLLDLACSSHKSYLQKCILVLLGFGLIFNCLHLNFFSMPMDVDSLELIILPLIWGFEGGFDLNHFIADTFSYFKKPLIAGLIFFMVLFSPPFSKEKPFFSSKILIAPFIVLFVSTWNSPIHNMPPMYSFWATAVHFCIGKNLDFNHKEEVKIIPQERAIQNVIFIIDESTNASYFSIYDNSQATTPFLEQLLKEKILITHGPGCTAANYSTSNDALIRFGGDLHQISKKSSHELHKAAPIFKYAKKAGFETSYIDSQVLEGLLNSYMTKNEVKDIDFLHQKKVGSSDKTIDHDMLVFVENQLKRPKPQFVFIRKNGSHAPFSATYPVEHSPFQCQPECSAAEKKLYIIKILCAGM